MVSSDRLQSLYKLHGMHRLLLVWCLRSGSAGYDSGRTTGQLPKRLSRLQSGLSGKCHHLPATQNPCDRRRSDRGRVTKNRSFQAVRRTRIVRIGRRSSRSGTRRTTGARRRHSRICNQSLKSGEKTSDATKRDSRGLQLYRCSNTASPVKAKIVGNSRRKANWQVLLGNHVYSVTASSRSSS